MSEVQTRPPHRSRGQPRGGRGGFHSTRPARGSHTSGSGGSNAAQDALEDQGEVGQLKKQYSGQLLQLKDLFPNWTPEDLVFALKENHGDVELTATRIYDGLCSSPVDFPPSLSILLLGAINPSSFVLHSSS